jgi:AraC family transcriptional activator of pobA
MDGVTINLDFLNNRIAMNIQLRKPAISKEAYEIPSFFLYGEPPRDVSDRFLHLEDLEDRSRPSEWMIRTHAHRDLNHVFFIQTGGGEMRAESRNVVFKAPAILLVPARCVHGFAWQPESTGRVLTVSDAYLVEATASDSGIRALFEEPGALSITTQSREASLIDDAFTRLGRELAWTAPGHAMAVEALLISLLVEVLRLAHRQNADSHVRGPQVEIVARFRAEVEKGFRQPAEVSDYAQRLGLSAARLRAACLQVARKSPRKMIEERLLLEAKRMLLYSNMTVSEAAYYLGFDDPAYFSRVFRRNAGHSPRAFRKTRLRSTSGV